MDIQKIDIELLKTSPLPDYSDDAHKGTKGKLLIIGGSRRIPRRGDIGCARRASRRMRFGASRRAGKRRASYRFERAGIDDHSLPETAAGTVAFSAVELVAEQCKICDAAVIGPGLDADDETDKFAREVVQMAPLSLVVDASAISALGSQLRGERSGACVHASREGI
jgi:NAD(P)H-hydrate repair Nnr-like enzyme with NAD(P)H-hydrate dehydratase domain